MRQWIRSYTCSRCVASACEDNMQRLFPCALIVLDLGAAVVYAASGDWRRAMYWSAAAILTSTVTF